MSNVGILHEYYIPVGMHITL